MLRRRGEMILNIVKSKKFLCGICAVGLIVLCAVGVILGQHVFQEEASASVSGDTPTQAVEAYLQQLEDKEWTLSLTVYRICEVDKQHFVDTWKSSETWEAEGWQEDNIAVIDAYYEVSFDEQSPEVGAFNPGRVCQQFYVIRKSADAQWEIWDFMTPYDNAF